MDSIGGWTEVSKFINVPISISFVELEISIVLKLIFCILNQRRKRVPFYLRHSYHSFLSVFHCAYFLVNKLRMDDIQLQLLFFIRKNTRYFIYPPCAIARNAEGQSSFPYNLPRRYPLESQVYH